MIEECTWQENVTPDQKKTATTKQTLTKTNTLPRPPPSPPPPPHLPLPILQELAKPGFQQLVPEFRHYTVKSGKLTLAHTALQFAYRAPRGTVTLNAWVLPTVTFYNRATIFQGPNISRLWFFPTVTESGQYPTSHHNSNYLHPLSTMLSAWTVCSRRSRLLVCGVPGKRHLESIPAEEPRKRRRPLAKSILSDRSLKPSIEAAEEETCSSTGS